MTRRRSPVLDLFSDQPAPPPPRVPTPPPLRIDPMPAGWTPDPLPELHADERTLRLDFETTGLAWWGKDVPVGVAWYLGESGRRGYTAWGHKGGGNATDEATARRWFEREIRDRHIDNANTRFDIHIGRAGLKVDLCAQNNTFGDVQHRAALLDDSRMQFNLDLLGHDYLGRGKVKLDFDKGRLHELPAWMIAPYGVEDVTLVHDLCAVMDPEIHAQDLDAVHKLEQDIIPIVVEMEKNGAWLDMDLLAQWCDQASEEFEALLTSIYRATGFRPSSPDSPKDLERLFNLRGIPITAHTKQGRPSFTGDVLKRAAEHDDVIKAIYYAGQLADLKSKYLDKYAATVRADGWIRFNLHQLRSESESNGDGFGAVSGRFSSAGDKDPVTKKPLGFNVQQVVSADKQTSRGWCSNYIIRNLFVAGTPEERRSADPPRWLAADAKQIEYRIFAAIANAPEIIAAYDRDPETDYHDVVQAILKRAKPDIQRKKTKITNFCKLFGAALLKFAWTLETISDQQFAELDQKYHGKYGKDRIIRAQAAIDGTLESCLREGIEVYDLYDQQFPDAKRMLDLAKATAKERGYVKTMLGRRARFGSRNGRVHSALNRAVQGTAADINKLMLVDAYKNRDLLKLRLRFTVHDELDADCFDASPAHIARIEEFLNQQRLDLRVPILWDVGIGSTWGTAKGKA
jgi:DNA polymerase-1